MYILVMLAAISPEDLLISFLVNSKEEGGSFSCVWSGFAI